VNVLEHRYKAHDPDRGACAGGASSIRAADEKGPSGKTRCAVVVSCLVVRGDAKRVRVQLGEQELTPEPGETPIEPPLQLPAGSALGIEFDGVGSVEIVGERVKAVNTGAGSAV